jgi:hypothetical protein
LNACGGVRNELGPSVDGESPARPDIVDEIAIARADIPYGVLVPDQKTKVIPPKRFPEHRAPRVRRQTAVKILFFAGHK